MASETGLPAGRELTFRRSAKLDAPPEAVYDILADIATHLEWGGTKSKKNFRLTSIDATETPAREGTQWSSKGIAPDGTFEDRSVVTQASRPNTFEFRTEAHVSFKKGGEGTWTVMNRYDVAPDGSGSRVTYTQKVTGASELGPLKMMLNPVFAVMGRMMVGSLIKPSLQNLGAMAARRT